MYAFDVSSLATTDRQAASGVIVLLVVYGPAAAAFSYCVSFGFKSPSLCALVLIVSGFLIALGGPITIFILEILARDDPNDPRDNLLTAADVIAWILRIFFPTFNLGKGLLYIINVESFEYLEGKDLTAWDPEILLLEVIFLVIQTFAYMLLALQLDVWSSSPKAVSIWQGFLRVVSCSWAFKKQKEEVDITTALPDDSDVIAEQDRVLAGEANNDLIVISQLTKVYDNQKVAVNNMSLGIPPGMTFGLLGINGAGKTTTMGMVSLCFQFRFWNRVVVKRSLVFYCFS